MAVYLSPGVFTNEIDLSVLPSAQSDLVPAFIGTAQKGPMNTPTLITTADQYIDTFGNPFTDSEMGWAVIAYLEEGNLCYVLRVGVEYTDGMDVDLAAIAVDVSGAKEQGWGRIPLFTGIDYGTIALRTPTTAVPVVIHAASATFASYTDNDGSGAVASIIFTNQTYNGCVDDVLTLTITSDPDATVADVLEGAGYTIIDSAGNEVATGTLAISGTEWTSASVQGKRIDETGTAVDDGTDFYVRVESSIDLGVGDTFVWRVAPDNTTLNVSIDNVAATAIALTPGTISTATALVTAINTATPTPTGYQAVEVDGVPYLQTTTAGKWIQITGTCACVTELGVAQYAYDIPRSYLVADEAENYLFTSSNNGVVIDIIGAVTTDTLSTTISTGSKTAAQVASVIDASGTINGVDLVDSYAITVPGGTTNVLIITNFTNAKYSQLKMQATFSHLSTLKFAELLGIAWPYTRAYRGYTDTRVILPLESTTSPGTPDSGTAVDIAYYANIVGWLVAKYPGTWVDNYTAQLSVYVSDIAPTAGRFTLQITNDQGTVVDNTTDLSFDPAEDRYIGNVINEGSPIGGANGNDYVQWIAPPTSVYDTTAGDDVRVPAPVSKTFVGGENGIPASALDSAQLDRVVIGNAGLSTGIFAFQNPESYDINMLVIPGFSSGAVIGQALQFCENRGDVIFLVDPPIGLRPQEVIDWHNGMQTSDLTAAINSSYGALYWGWLKIYNQFEGGTIWVPPSGYVAQVYARTARVAEQWFAPAGLNRGRLPSVLDIEYNPTLGERDALYGNENAVNPIVKFAAEGITVWGQKTLQRTNTALNRVNVRMLLIFLKKEMSRTLKTFVFEQNDTFTRAQVSNVLNSFLADIAARRGLTAFKVVCDESNNTPERIDRNELWVSVFLKPTRAIEFVVLNLVVLRTGASFSASEVLAAGGVVQVQ